MVDRYRNHRSKRNYAPTPKSPTKIWRLFVILIILGISIKVIPALFSKKPIQPEPLASAVPSKKLPKIRAEEISVDIWNNLSINMQTLIGQNPDIDISVAVIDIGSNTKAGYGIQNNFAGASTTKILTASAYLHDIENNKYKLTSDGKKQLQLMINKSDNTAWDILNKKVGYSNMVAYARSIGISSYDWKNNIITAGDEALLLQKLYQRELLNEDHTSLILGHMQDTNNESMIPKVIPEGAAIWHKYGQLEDRLHDAAIINYQDRPIIIVVYTKGGASDGSNYTPRVKLVQDLAKTVINSIYQIN
jgi:beta-lactamase class A